MLLSSTGLTYAKHYCGEVELFSELTLGEKHLSCGMTMSIPDCDDEMELPGCCDNEYLQVDTDETFAKAQVEVTPPVQWVAVLATVFVLLDTDLQSRAPNFIAYYHPPPPEDDLLVKYERFLI